MEKFKLNLEYKVGKAVFSTNLFETEHFKITYKATKSHISLKMAAFVPFEILNLTASIPYNFKADSRVFANGYQSWTECREMFKDDRQSHTFGPISFAYRRTLLGAAGAYTFDDNVSRRGVFQGFSYMYVRNGEEYDLFASLTERTGYTIFTADFNSNMITVQKDLEGVIVDGEYEVLNFAEYVGDEDSVFDNWFDELNIPKPSVTPKNGYTTWYNYYSKINEKIVSDDLEALSKVKSDIDIFQIDDGYQSATGDWLTIDNKKFPNGMKSVADKIHSTGMLAGLWLAPFGAEFTSKTATQHHDWLIRKKNGHPVTCGINWGGFYALDIEVPEVKNYIKHFFDVILNDWGFDLVKLDFLYAAAIIPNHGKSRGQLMCEAMDFLRECVGEKMILGCGVPLMPAFGKVDYCRIGADMGLRWKVPFFSNREFISTYHTLGNSIFRRQLDGRAFLNDPDVFLLRDENIHCTFEQRKIIATVNKVFGSVLFTSDNVGKYSDEQMSVLLDTFKKSKIDVKSAEFLNENKRIMKFVYTQDGIEHTFKFNIDKGTIV